MSLPLFVVAKRIRTRPVYHRRRHSRTSTQISPHLSRKEGRSIVELSLGALLRAWFKSIANFSSGSQLSHQESRVELTVNISSNLCTFYTRGWLNLLLILHI